MSTSATTVSGNAAFKRATFRDTTLLLAVAWLVPFAVHLAPWSGERPLGAYLLPMFWTTFVAAYFYGAKIGALTGLFAPAVNLAVTGLPAWKFFGGLAVELVVFAIVVALAVRRFPRLVVLAPAAFVFAKLSALVVLTLAGTGGLAGFGRSLAGNLAGLAVLAAINFAVVTFYPKTRAK